jgi:transposase InsO family protein
MGHRGDASDNAIAESFFATLETELLDRRTFRMRNEARPVLFRSIEGFYDARRRHSTLGQPGPDRFEEMYVEENIREAIAVST